MAAVTTWKTTAADNNSAPPDGWPEGQAAASVNNCARQMMADIVREFQVNAVRVLASVAGTDTITGSMTPDLTSYSTGMMVIFTPANNNTGAATINIDSLGAKSIVKGDGTALESGDLQASTVHFMIYDGTNFVCLNPLSLSLTNATFSGTLTVNGSLTTDNTTADEVGYKGLPDNPQGGAYTLVLSDAGKVIRQTSGSAFAWTIPPNSSVAFPVGTVVTLLNPSGGGVVTVTQGAGVTIQFAGTASTTGNRTLTAIGLATIVKIATDTWVISGTGLS